MNPNEPKSAPGLCAPDAEHIDIERGRQTEHVQGLLHYLGQVQGVVYPVFSICCPTAETANPWPRC
jgi:hypothetical protein